MESIHTSGRLQGEKMKKQLSNAEYLRIEREGVDFAKIEYRPFEGAHELYKELIKKGLSGEISEEEVIRRMTAAEEDYFRNHPDKEVKRIVLVTKIPPERLLAKKEPEKLPAETKR